MQAEADAAAVEESGAQADVSTRRLKLKVPTGQMTCEGVRAMPEPDPAEFDARREALAEATKRLQKLDGASFQIESDRAALTSSPTLPTECWSAVVAELIRDYKLAVVAANGDISLWNASLRPVGVRSDSSLRLEVVGRWPSIGRAGGVDPGGICQL